MVFKLQQYPCVWYMYTVWDCNVRRIICSKVGIVWPCRLLIAPLWLSDYTAMRYARADCLLTRECPNLIIQLLLYAYVETGHYPLDMPSSTIHVCGWTFLHTNSHFGAEHSILNSGIWGHWFVINGFFQTASTYQWYSIIWADGKLELTGHSVRLNPELHYGRLPRRYILYIWEMTWHADSTQSINFNIWYSWLEACVNASKRRKGYRVLTPVVLCKQQV